MTIKDKEDLDRRIETQGAEFEAVAHLCKQYRRIQLTPIVDDDYLEVRHDYESAVRSLIEALRKNGRIDG